MNYKPSDVMNLVHEVKKLGWHFTHSKENISINRHNVMLSLYREVDPEAWREEYRKKQAAGVKFECFHKSGDLIGQWVSGNYGFNGDNKEDYREVPQEVSASECQKALEHLARTYSADKGTAQLNPTIPPHAAERALYWAQRVAGTNEVWQVVHNSQLNVASWMDIVDKEPQWLDGYLYRVKPMKLTAKIIRRGVYKTSYDWEFTGTREEYRAECEKYGYIVVSEIKEVVEKPETVKYYFALYKSKQGDIRAVTSQNKTWIEALPDTRGYTIIGDIESREVEV